MISYEAIPRWIIETPGHLNTRKVCIDAVGIEPLLLMHVPDHFKTQDMCIKALRNVHGNLNLFQIILRQG